MDKDTVIKVENLGKKFTYSLKRSLAYGSIDLAKNFIGMPANTQVLRKGEFWALDGVSFELKRGESLGLVGMNGSGKSTLLRMITGIFPPDAGKIHIRGRVSSLIAIGAGFHPHMTGRENIYLNGTILGMSRKEIDRNFDEIVDFADIGKFIDAPVSTYSSGMRVRLGFSVAVSSVPDILLIDEVLAVGDMKFQQKSMSKIGEIVRKGTSIILVSHQMLNIQKVCERAIMLDNGKVIKDAPTLETISEYYKVNTGEGDLFEVNERLKEDHTSSYGISYEYLKFSNQRGEETRKFESGDDINIEWKFNMDKPLENISLEAGIADGPYTYNGYSTYFDGIKLDKIDNNTVVKLKLKNVYLSPGSYSVSIGIWDEKFIGAYFWDYESTGKIEILATKKIQGRFEFVHEWSISNSS